MDTTVLVVEDDVEINELLGEYLALENIRYLSALTGQAGIHQATTHHPDAVILDLMLPDIDGFEVARTLSTHRISFDIPIIILSCMCQKDDRVKGFASGALYYMNKPFLPDDLLATLRRALDWKANLKTRNPAGEFTLGNASPEDAISLAQSVRLMTSDLYARTDLSDTAIAHIREALETLAQWNIQWNLEHSQTSHLAVQYHITPLAPSSPATPAAPSSTPPPATIEWKLSEDSPGILTDAFFKPLAGTAGVPGWGVGSLVTRPLAPIAPPAKWIQVLAKSGAARFEKDTKTHTVRFARTTGSPNGSNTPGNGASILSNTVPVVEIDGNRIPNRVRDEALAARRK